MLLGGEASKCWEARVIIEEVSYGGMNQGGMNDCLEGMRRRREGEMETLVRESSGLGWE